DAAVPAFHQPGAERLVCGMAGHANRQCKGRREIERVEPDFAVDAPLFIERDRQTSPQPRTVYDAVDIVEGELVAGKRGAREQPDIVGHRIGWLEAEHRREIDAANLQIDAGLWRLRPGLRRALCL